jgi:hypothetical protein
MWNSKIWKLNLTTRLGCVGEGILLREKIMGIFFSGSYN